MVFRFGVSNLGVAASALCAVHCAALPLIAGASCCVQDSALHSPVVESSLVGVAALIGYATLIPAFRHHRRPLPLGLLTAGLALMVAAHNLVPEGLSLPAALGGSLLLIAAQLVNRRCPAACCAHGHTELA